MSKKPVNTREKPDLTAYTKRMLGIRLPSLPESMREAMMNEAEAMSAIGVNSEEDHKDFMYVVLHTRGIAEDISGRKLDAEILSKLSHIVFSNRMGSPIDTIFNFYRAVGGALNQLGIPIKKTAYPLGQSTLRAQHPRNTKKWMQTMREIYFMVHQGVRYSDALSHVTAKWDVMEKYDFENWLSFYQEGAHEKYKTAKEDEDDVQYLQFGGQGIPIGHLGARLPNSPHGMPRMERVRTTQDADDAEEEAAAEETERLEMIDKKVNSIGGRLRSALKLLSDPEVQEALDGKLDVGLVDFVKQVQDLQRHILLVAPSLKNKNSSTLEDFIIQKGNRLIAQGHPRAGELIKRFAQPEPPPVEELEGAPDAPATAPATDAPEREGVTSDAPDAPEGEGDAPELEELDPEAMGFEDEADRAWVRDFKNNLNNVEDKKDKGEVEDLSMADDVAEITVEAQPIDEPVPMPPEEMPEEMLEEAPEDVAIEVEEPPEGLEEPEMKEIGNLEGVTVADVVERLERVSNILKNREIPRELAWIDFMLDKIGLASYFPSLAEATKSALESNQYMSTRVEEILSKLRGSIEPEEPIELATTEEKEEVTGDTLQQVRQNLESREDKERAKKERRQEEEETPEPPIPAEELAQPVSVETAPPTPVRPERPAPAPIR